MSKSIKLKDNNYWDSSSVVYNQEQLDSVLADIIGKIIKNSGTWNTNHHYIRFKNGMAVCFGRQVLSNISTTEANKGGSLYWIDNLDIELPIHFKDLNYQVVCLQAGNTLMFPYGTTKTQTDHFDVHLVSPTTRSNSNIVIDYVAWGFSKA